METPRSALMDLSFGTLRRYGRVQAIVREMSRHVSADIVLGRAALVLDPGARKRTIRRAHSRSSGGRCLRLARKMECEGLCERRAPQIPAGAGFRCRRIEKDPEACYQHPPGGSRSSRSPILSNGKACLKPATFIRRCALRVNRRRQDVGGVSDATSRDGNRFQARGRLRASPRKTRPGSEVARIRSGRCFGPGCRRTTRGALSGSGRRTPRARCVRRAWRQERAYSGERRRRA